MSKKCADCGCEVNPNVIQGMYYCPRCDDDKAERDVLPLTVFDHITESEEALANELVYKKIDSFYCTSGAVVRWTSTISDWEYDAKSEAIAATIEELKKEAR